MTIPYPMNAEPMMKCARHWPRWSARQNPNATMPPNSICVQLTTGINLPIQPCAMTTMRRPPRPVELPNTRPSHPFRSSKWSFNPMPIPTCTIVISTKLLAKLAWM